MFARVQKALAKKDQGFTLIELLVVIIIIGILSAIAIPVFLNQRQKAVDAGIKSDLRTVATEVETSYTDLQVYPAGASADEGTPNVIAIGTATVTLSSGNAITYAIAGDPEAFCIYGTNTKGSGKDAAGFTYDSANGGLQTGAAAANSCS